MRPALLLLLFSAARTDVRDIRERYQRECLYCHSEAVVEQQKRTVAEWRTVLDRMHRRAPLLVSRDDARVLLRYLTVDLGLARPPPRRTPQRALPTAVVAAPTLEPPHEVPPEPQSVPVPEVVPEPAPEPDAIAPEPEPAPPLVAATSDPEAERDGPALLEEKCSKCHPLGRVFTKVDTLERGMSTIERMRRKTGSGITRADAELLERYLRTQM